MGFEENEDSLSEQSVQLQRMSKVQKTRKISVTKEGLSVSKTVIEKRRSSKAVLPDVPVPATLADINESSEWWMIISIGLRWQCSNFITYSGRCTAHVDGDVDELAHSTRPGFGACYTRRQQEEGSRLH